MNILPLEVTAQSPPCFSVRISQPNLLQDFCGLDFPIPEPPASAASQQVGVNRRLASHAPNSLPPRASTKLSSSTKMSTSTKLSAYMQPPFARQVAAQPQDVRSLRSTFRTPVLSHARGVTPDSMHWHYPPDLHAEAKAAGNLTSKGAIRTAQKSRTSAELPAIESESRMVARQYAMAVQRCHTVCQKPGVSADSLQRLSAG